MIVLQIQETKALFTLEKRHMSEIPLVEVEPVRIGISF
jgi:hypothetical protein